MHVLSSEKHQGSCAFVHCSYGKLPFHYWTFRMLLVLLMLAVGTDSLSLLPEGLQSVFICWLRVCKLSVCHCLCAEGLLTGNLLSSVDGRFRMLSWRTLFRCLPIMGWRQRFALPLALPVVRTHFPITHLALLSNLLCAQVWVRCSWRDGNVTATLWDSLSSSFQACVV